MDYNFTSLEQLFKRVRPALHARCSEFNRLGYFDIKDIDIWNYLLEAKWKKGKDLMLSDIVNDIMNADIPGTVDSKECKIVKEARKSVKDNIEII